MPKITFVNATLNERHEVLANNGETVLELARRSNIDIEGACEGCMACSTCHVVVSERHFQELVPAAPEEIDMLDLAFGLEKTSRLGCQMIINDRCEGMVLKVPSSARNLLLG